MTGRGRHGGRRGAAPGAGRGGGGAWDALPGEGDGAPGVEIVADVHDFCRMVGHRLTPAQLGASVRGDGAVAERVLEAARIFAA